MIIFPFPVIKQPNPSQDVCPAVHPTRICSVVPSLIFALSCGFMCCVCDVVSLLAPLWCGFWSLLSCGRACVWSSGWRWVKSTRRTRERSIMASRSCQSRVRWAWTIPSWYTACTFLKCSHNLWINVKKSSVAGYRSYLVEMRSNSNHVVSIQGPDVLSEPSEGGRRRELKAAASSQRAEWGIPCKARVLFTGLSCELQRSHKHVE